MWRHLDKMLAERRNPKVHVSTVDRKLNDANSELERQGLVVSDTKQLLHVRFHVLLGSV